MSPTSIQRRNFLKAAGVSLALPLLESCPGASAAAPTTPPRRLVCIGNEFGMYPGAFWPESFGTDYESTTLLKPLDALRSRFTLFSHLDHGLKGGHFAVHTFLTGVKASEARGMAEGGISLDQRAAEHVGSRTRFPSLTIGSESGLHGGCQMSWTRTGARVPPISGPRELFRSLFVDDDSTARERVADRIKQQGSILDLVLGDAKSLQRRLGKADRAKLEEYFSSVRDVEVKLEFDRRWQNVPKPDTEFAEPENQGLTRDLPVIYDLIALALQTDSTRVATLEIASGFVASDLGIKKGYHSLSHHGHVPENIEQLVEIELYQVQHFAQFLQKLDGITEPGQDGTLLDQSIVLMGSGMGNANSHTNTDLPVILAGGGFKHGEHKELPREQHRRIPLSNLYVSLLQSFGMECDSFANSTGSLTLESA